jgi:hypothetical protein
MVRIRCLKSFGVVAGALGLFAAGFRADKNGKVGGAMKTKLSIVVTGVLAMAMLVLSAAPTPAFAQTATTLKRLAAAQQSTPVFTFISDGLGTFGTGLPIYSTSVKVSGNHSILYVSVSGAAAGDSDAFFYNCQVDGVACDSSSNSFWATAPGWQEAAANDFDDDLEYGEQTAAHTWCIPVDKGSHTVSLAIANSYGDSFNGTDTNLLQSSVTIDTNKIKAGANACGTY